MIKPNDNELLHAELDGALSEEDAARLRGRMAEDEVLRAQAAELKRLAALLDDLKDAALPPAIADEVMRAVAALPRVQRLGFRGWVARSLGIDSSRLAPPANKMIISEPGAQPQNQTGTAGGGVIVAKKILWGVAGLVVVAVLAIIYFAGNPRVDRGGEGTIGAAKRAVGEQPSSVNVTTGDAQKFLQSDTFDSIIKNKEVRGLLANPELCALLTSAEFTALAKSENGRAALTDVSAAAALKAPEIQAFLSDKNTLSLLIADEQAEHIRRLSGDEQAAFVHKRLTGDDPAAFMRRLSSDEQGAFMRRLSGDEQVTLLRRLSGDEPAALMRRFAENEQAELRKKLTGDEQAALKRRMQAGDEQLAQMRKLTGDEQAAFFRKLTGDEQDALRRRLTGDEQNALRRKLTGDEQAAFMRRLMGDEQAAFCRKRLTADEQAAFMRRLTAYEQASLMRRLTGDEQDALRRKLTGDEQAALKANSSALQALMADDKFARLAADPAFVAALKGGASRLFAAQGFEAALKDSTFMGVIGNADFQAALRNQEALQSALARKKR